MIVCDTCNLCDELRQIRSSKFQFGSLRLLVKSIQHWQLQSPPRALATLTPPFLGHLQFTFSSESKKHQLCLKCCQQLVHFGLQGYYTGLCRRITACPKGEGWLNDTYRIGECPQ